MTCAGGEKTFWMPWQLAMAPTSARKLADPVKTDSISGCITHRNGRNVTSAVRIGDAQPGQNFYLISFHVFGILRTGFMVPALGMQRAMHQQMRIVGL